MKHVKNTVKHVLQQGKNQSFRESDCTYAQITEREVYTVLSVYPHLGSFIATPSPPRILPPLLTLYLPS